MKTQKILITGGHVTPAIALIDEIAQKYPQWSVVYVGRNVAIEGTAHVSPERALVEGRGVRFLAITAGRLTRALTIQSLISWMKLPIGFVQGVLYCIRERPNVVISFGGYVALPVAIGAFLLRIPVVTHEQTLVPGLANRIIARFARRICVSFAESMVQFPSANTVLTGLPIRSEFFARTRKRPTGIKNGKDLVYITGGSTGATSLNDIVFEALREMLHSYTIVHQTGKLSYPKAMRIWEGLPDDLKPKYIIADYFLAEDVAWLMRNALVVVGRSGANTVMELAILAKPSVLVPLPWSSGGEQLRNAQWLADLGLADVIVQGSLSPQLLAQKVDTIARKPVKKRTNEALARIPTDGALRLAAEIADILS